MLRTLAPLALALALVLVPAAAADTSVAVGPRGVVDPQKEPYYAWLHLAPPDAPRPAEPADDCAASDPAGRPGATSAAKDLAHRLLAWDPMTDFGAGSWFPACVGASTPTCESDPCPPLAHLAHAYASYNVTTGRYYVEAATPLLPVATTSAAYTLTGTTGVALRFDCVGCPPPTCCVD